jgi:5-methyltetrahydrofolate--homocysteine methyltransferase
MNQFKIPLNLSSKDVLPFLGIDKEASPQELQLINLYIDKAMKKARPLGVWKTFSVKSFEPERINLEDCPLVLEGLNTSEHFKTCDKITLLAATLGPEIDLILNQLAGENAAHALFLDGVASAAIENFTEQMDLYLSEEIRRKGYFPTARFSPGYGDWPLSWQKHFLDSIDGAKIGLTTTPYFLLQPIKSVTAALGWSKIPVERNYKETDNENSAGNKPIKPCRGSQACRYCNLAPFCRAK